MLCLWVWMRGGTKEQAWGEQLTHSNCPTVYKMTTATQPNVQGLCLVPCVKGPKIRHLCAGKPVATLLIDKFFVSMSLHIPGAQA